ncbi:MAG: hypothetical protein ACRDHE_02655 [Ktedonobacterales bacterium]
MQTQDDGVGRAWLCLRGAGLVVGAGHGELAKRATSAHAAQVLAGERAGGVVDALGMVQPARRTPSPAPISAHRSALPLQRSGKAG